VAGTVVLMPGSAVADLVGRVLAGRYRLLAPIGAGASGRVYVADDVRLRRRVAVKVLHAALAEDAGFLRRFRTEAQLAASLNHPNVMAVYDWGDDGVPFMVLELLVGGSLRGMLDRGPRLTPAQAAYVGRQVASALEYAHGRGLVHRDVKPANLLFDEHGIVRVADFGLARALAEASWTEPAGTVLGTARYAAPEQGSGARADGRGDLYALGLVLSEAVTGVVPLVGETPLGTLRLRDEESVTAPAALSALGPVVERACRADPSERYPDAATMGAALDDAVRVLPPPGPLPLGGLGEGSVDPHPTQVVGVRVDPVFDQDARAVAPPAPRRVATRESRVAPLVLAAVLLLAVMAVVFALTRSSTGAPVTVPLLVGTTEDIARNRAQDAGFLPSFTERHADDPLGTVISQEPASGDYLGRGGTVRLVVSKGPKPTNLPDVLGRPSAEAEAALVAADYVVEKVPEYNETVAKDLVVRTEPARKAPRFGTVKLIVSDGPAPVTVPDVTGKSFAEAAQALQDARLGAQQVDEFHDTVPVGQVVRTDPPAGQQAARDSVVAVVVSKGPDLVPVPTFKAMTVEQASAAAAAGGVQVQAQGVFTGGRKVRAQDPAEGTQVKRGSVVTIFF